MDSSCSKLHMLVFSVLFFFEWSVPFLRTISESYGWCNWRFSYPSKSIALAVQHFFLGVSTLRGIVIRIVFTGMVSQEVLRVKCSRQLPMPVYTWQLNNVRAAKLPATHPDPHRCFSWNFSQRKSLMDWRLVMDGHLRLRCIADINKLNSNKIGFKRKPCMDKASEHEFIVRVTIKVFSIPAWLEKIANLHVIRSKTKRKGCFWGACGVTGESDV